ncbi:MAG: MBL fold metallo-hydrolase [Alicyclobacillus sp.]|nr:MBL fold metallo-hydrolase [Alicyclobacillus sp.]
MEFSVLASGSSGNAVWVRSPGAQILVDAGISAAQLDKRLQAAAGCSLTEVDALLLTHEHVDHVRGLKQALKRHPACRVFATAGTWHAATHAWEAAEAVAWTPVQAGSPWTLGDLQVTPFSVSHDAEEPVAYRFDCGGASLTILTDLGYVSDRIKTVVRGCAAYIWEANHDPAMLRSGRYPWHVKRRILGDKGHLSNEDAAVALADLLDGAPVDVYLAHLSEENNHPDLAELTFTSVLQECQPTAAAAVRLYRTHRTHPTPRHVLLGGQHTAAVGGPNCLL